MAREMCASRSPSLDPTPMKTRLIGVAGGSRLARPPGPPLTAAGAGGSDEGRAEEANGASPLPKISGLEPTALLLID